MDKRVIIIHGWEGKPDSNWFPWLKNELEKRDIEVVLEEMPNPDYPVCDEWVAKISELAGEPNKNTILVGHSLGVMAILRYLESLSDGKMFGGIIMVAGFTERLVIDEIENFFKDKFDYDRVKQKAKRFIAIHSNNDPYVPIERGETIRDNLGADLIVVKGAGHFNESDGCTSLPVVLEKIFQIFLISGEEITG